MFSGESLDKNISPVPKEMEISLKSEKDIKNLESLLQSLIGSDGADQLIFVLRSMAEEDFVNHCKDATLEFGQRLAKRFGEEESFFEILPVSDLYDARSYKPLDKVGYSKDYHSVVLLRIKPDGKEASSLIFDLTYGSVSSKSEKEDGILVLHSSGTKEQMMDMLNGHYGGLWKAELRFNKKDNHFVFIDENPGNRR